VLAWRCWARARTRAARALTAVPRASGRADLDREAPGGDTSRSVDINLAFSTFRVKKACADWNMAGRDTTTHTPRRPPPSARTPAAPPPARAVAADRAPHAAPAQPHARTHTAQK
jgi:hypothetical protein